MFESTLQSTMSEALAFGYGIVFVERFLDKPGHIGLSSFSAAVASHRLAVPPTEPHSSVTRSATLFTSSTAPARRAPRRFLLPPLLVSPFVVLRFPPVRFSSPNTVLPSLPTLHPVALKTTQRRLEIRSPNSPSVFFRLKDSGSRLSGCSEDVNDAL
jgi:hypothetical protein